MIPPPPSFPLDDDEDDGATSTVPEKAARAPPRARFSSEYLPAASSTPDLSGAQTEPRRGASSNALSQQGKSRPKKLSAGKSDFDTWDSGDRYQLKRMLGRGSYGEVAQALDLNARRTEEDSNDDEQAFSQQTGSPSYVAVKKIYKAFDQEVDAIRLYREMHILRRLRGHSCVIQLVDIVQPRSSDLKDFNDIYLVFEYAP